MGVEARVLLGRIKTPTEPPKEHTETGIGLEIFQTSQLRYEDIEFADLPEHIEINRNSKLFGFLAGVRGDTKPLYDGYDRKSQTQAFMKWCDEQRNNDHPEPKGYYSFSDNSFTEHYDLGEHSFILHSVAVLAAFDYDQIAEIKDENNQSKEPVYYRPMTGNTYREMFSGSFFDLITYCQEQGFQFIIFGFEC